MTTNNNHSSTRASSGISIQQLLGHAYSLYLFGFIFGMGLDGIFKIHFKNVAIEVIGFIIILGATFLMYWAQNANRIPKGAAPLGRKDFFKGPYKFTRHPTHLSLTLLILGAGFLMNSVIISILAVILAIISRFTFIAREERKLEKKYGNLYTDYKKRVQPFI